MVLSVLANVYDTFPNPHQWPMLMLRYEGGIGLQLGKNPSNLRLTFKWKSVDCQDWYRKMTQFAPLDIFQTQSLCLLS